MDVSSRDGTWLNYLEASHAAASSWYLPKLRSRAEVDYCLRIWSRPTSHDRLLRMQVQYSASYTNKRKRELVDGCQPAREKR